MIEIERKFLVRSEAFREEAYSTEKIRQGFLNSDPERTVRIRVTGKYGYITVKGVPDTSGLRRFEWEKEIAGGEARELLGLCEETIVEKTRYCVRVESHIFEVDVFQGANLGLVIAEIELREPNEVFKKPHWLGREVTGEIKYYNSQLSKKPYNTWKS